MFCVQCKLHISCLKFSICAFHHSTVKECCSAVALLDKPMWEKPEKSMWTKRMINAAPSPNKTVDLSEMNLITCNECGAPQILSCVTKVRAKLYRILIMIVVVFQDFREKNTEHMRPEVVSLLRSSERAFLHHLVASSPEALFRWGVLRATIRILSVFKNMGRQRAECSM